MPWIIYLDRHFNRWLTREELVTAASVAYYPACVVLCLLQHTYVAVDIGRLQPANNNIQPVSVVAILLQVSN